MFSLNNQSVEFQSNRNDTSSIYSIFQNSKNKHRIIISSEKKSYNIYSSLEQDNPFVSITFNDQLIAEYLYNQKSENWNFYSNKYKTSADFISDHVKLLDEHLPIAIDAILYLENQRIGNKKSKLNIDRTETTNNCQGLFYKDMMAQYNISCNGEYYEYGCTKFSYRNSICCMNAVNCIQSECTNHWCIGCCWTGCDSVCAMGDYYCSCDPIGISCSSNDGGLLPDEPILLPSP